MCLYTWRIHQSERAAPLVYNSRGEWRMNHQSQVGQRKRKTPIQSLPTVAFGSSATIQKNFSSRKLQSNVIHCDFLKSQFCSFVRVAV
jgi:hypothetical protein